MKLTVVAVLSLLGAVLLAGCAASTPLVCPDRVTITDHGCRDDVTGQWTVAACCEVR